MFSEVQPGSLQTSKIENYATTPVGNYMFKVSNRNTRTRCEMCSKLTIKTPEVKLYVYHVS